MKRKHVALLVPLTFMSGIFIFALCTSSGAALLVKIACAAYPDVGVVSAGSIQGTLLGTVKLENIRVSSSSLLPPGAELEIQNLDVTLTFPRLRVVAIVHNGRARFPGSDTVGFFGTYRAGELDCNVFTTRLPLHLIRDMALPRLPADVRATVLDVDIFIRGRVRRPLVTGNFKLMQASRGPLSLSEAPCLIDLEVNRDTQQFFGTVRFERGVVSAPHGVSAHLGESVLTFVGPVGEPLLDIRGQALVEDTLISCSLTGTPDAPDIKLFSFPSLSQERLLLMLATGKKWSGTQGMVGESTQPGVSADAIKDFIDFFLLRGAGTRSAGALGIKNISLTFTGLEKGAAFSIGLTRKFDARYGIRQTLDEFGSVTTSQMIGGEYQLMRRIFVGAQQETSQQQPGPLEESVYEDISSEGNSTIYMKFKSEF